ncbi:GNAT family N-acetyltransferase [Acinetobacter guerrae]|uniref:GNAT family N-acetyltransferase n=1 Tax=Acinetobacter guerrae TaxID=1843371 RepID=A0A3A8EJW3_9GAMM|nr:GNAT family N-acetyltransferase [Acinetobacter guerrae]RKG35182.1 GNAT family N-acetyltransferase [Acinetobacter guerrae]
MILRVANLSDIPILVQFGELFIAESPNYQEREYDPEKVASHYKTLLKDGLLLVVENDGQVVGGFAGGIGKDWFNDQKIAFDYVLYVKPEHRKTRVAYMLVDGFIRWAQLNGASRIQVGTTTGVESKGCIRLYGHFGLKQYGTLLDMELKA